MRRRSHYEPRGDGALGARSRTRTTSAPCSGCADGSRGHPRVEPDRGRRAEHLRHRGARHRRRRRVGLPPDGRAAGAPASTRSYQDASYATEYVAPGDGELSAFQPGSSNPMASTTSRSSRRTGWSSRSRPASRSAPRSTTPSSPPGAVDAHDGVGGRERRWTSTATEAPLSRSSGSASSVPARWAPTTSAPWSPPCRPPRVTRGLRHGHRRRRPGRRRPPVGGRAADSAEELVASTTSTPCVIASPDHTHAELVLACLEAGKPVLCEKPLAVTARPTPGGWSTPRSPAVGGCVQVGFMRRFDPAFVELQALGHRRATLGESRLVHAVHRNASAPTSTDDAGLVTGSMIHELDTLPWLLGEPLISASASSRRSPKASATRSSRRSGRRRRPMVTAEVFVNAGYGYDVRCEVVGTGGTACLVPRGRRSAPAWPGLSGTRSATTSSHTSPRPTASSSRPGSGPAWPAHPRGRARGTGTSRCWRPAPASRPSSRAAESRSTPALGPPSTTPNPDRSPADGCHPRSHRSRRRRPDRRLARRSCWPVACPRPSSSPWSTPARAPRPGSPSRWASARRHRLGAVLARRRRRGRHHRVVRRARRAGRGRRRGRQARVLREAGRHDADRDRRRPAPRRRGPEWPSRSASTAGSRASSPRPTTRSPAGRLGDVRLLRSVTRDPGDGPADPAAVPRVDDLHPDPDPRLRHPELAQRRSTGGRRRRHRRRSDPPRSSRDHGHLDTAVVVIRYDNGAIAVAEASFAAAYGYDVRGEVLGSRGMVTMGEGATRRCACTTRAAAAAVRRAATSSCCRRLHRRARASSPRRPDGPPGLGRRRRRLAALRDRQACIDVGPAGAAAGCPSTTEVRGDELHSRRLLGDGLHRPAAPRARASGSTNAASPPRSGAGPTRTPTRWPLPARGSPR